MLSSSLVSQRLRAWIVEFMQFGAVGASAFVIDAGLFNVFQYAPMPLGFLSGHPNSANVLAATIATIYSWIANRLWTYRGRTQENVVREGTLFVIANILGLCVTQACLISTRSWVTTLPPMWLVSLCLLPAGSSSTTLWCLPAPVRVKNPSLNDIGALVHTQQLGLLTARDQVRDLKFALCSILLLAPR